MRLSVSELKERTGVVLPKDVESIVALRDIESVHCIEAMSDCVLESLLRNVPLKSDIESKPYKDSNIEIYSIDPKGLCVGQSFVHEEKILSLLTGFQSVFKGFCSGGLSKLYPLTVYGTAAKEDVAALYVPPIIESFNGSHVILDGIHRSFLSMGAGTTMTYVVITKKQRNLEEELESLPFTPRGWDAVKMFKEKPKREDRYFGLKDYNFRRLDYVGIDG
jgi:hypothetical protein